MKVLFIADVPPNPDSGASGTEFQTIKALRDLGLEVNTVWDNGLSHRIKHGNLHALIEQPFSYRSVMLKKLRESDYNVIHANQPHGYRAARALRQLKRKSIFIHRSHGFELRVVHDLTPWEAVYKNNDRPVVRRFFSKIMAYGLAHNSYQIVRYADGHIVSATQCATYLSDVMGVPPERIAVIPQAPPPLFFEHPSLPMTADRLKRVLYVGQFAFVKAPMILAEVFNQIAAERGDIAFTWVCAKEHHQEAAILLKNAVRSRVTFLDWMDQQSLMEIYDLHGIFLFPSFFEGFGKAFLEAMSRGLCVIAADNGGAHDVIESQVNGILTATGNVDLTVDACLKLLTDYSFANTISANAAATARQYTWERVATETVAFYQKRLEAKSRSFINS